MAVSNEEILEAIAQMPVMKVVELIEAMEEKFNVTAGVAGAPVAVAGAGGGGATADHPTGWCTTRIRLAPLGAVVSWPESRTASSLNQRKNSAA